MFEGLDMKKMSDMILKMQNQAKELENESKTKEFTAKVGGGMVSVTINGEHEVLDLSIDDSLLEDKEALVILLISAFNNVNKMAEDDKRNSIAKMMGGVDPFSL